MKVALDTNIIIAWIRERKYSEIILDIRTQKFMPCHVLMELWTGARTKQGARLVEKFQMSFLKASRIIELRKEHYIAVGQMISDMPNSHKARLSSAGFLSDIFIAVSALSIGAVLYTSNKADFDVISEYLPEFKYLAV